MSSLDQMKQLAEALLQPDNNIRAQAEATLAKAALESPDNFVIFNIQIMQSENIPLNIRTSSVVLLKKNLLIGKNKNGLYLKLNDNVRDSFRKEILLCINKLQNINLIEKVCDLIADLASSLFNDESGSIPESIKWGNLIQHVFELYSTGKLNSILASLRILEGLFDQTEDKLVVFNEQFMKLYSSGFQNNDFKVKTATINTLMTMVLNFKPKHSTQFKIFGKNVLTCLMEAIQQKDEESIKKINSKIFDVCQTIPSYFKKLTPDLVIVMSKARELDNDPNSSLKSESVESLIFILERYPEIVKQNNAELLKQIIELIFKNMIEIEDEINDEWKSPPDGFNDDLIEDDDQKIIKIGIDFIDRLINVIGHKFMLPFVSEYIKKMLASDNWKMHHAAIMVLSQIGEYLYDQENEVKKILEIFANYYNNPNPRIRYACCHALGQFAEDLAPEFQTNFHVIFFNMVLPLLKDNVPRVVAHALAALTNFLENADPDQIKDHFNFLYEQINFHLQNGILFVKEATLSTLSALAEGSRDLFLPYYNNVLALIINILKDQSSSHCKQLKGGAIECVSIIAKCFDKKLFIPYSEQVIKEIINIQTHNIDYNDADP